MKKYFLFFSIATSLVTSLTAQSIGIGTTSPHNSSILELNSTSQGILIPRMTEIQRTTILSPAQGLLVYQSNNDTGFYFFQGTQWRSLNNSGTRFIYAFRKQPSDELWTAKLDGTDARQIPISIPLDEKLNMGPDQAPSISPDGKLILFLTRNITTGNYKVYRSNIDGSNTIKIIDYPNGVDLMLGNIF